jgi:hypothetical protein
MPAMAMSRKSELISLINAVETTPLGVMKSSPPISVQLIDKTFGYGGSPD